MNLATIDIGTNTTLLLVARSRAAPSRCSRSAPRSPGSAAASAASGALDAEAIARTLAALRDYAAVGAPPRRAHRRRRHRGAAARRQRGRVPGPGRRDPGHPGRGDRRRARGRADVSRGRRVVPGVRAGRARRRRHRRRLDRDRARRRRGGGVSNELAARLRAPDGGVWCITIRPTDAEQAAIAGAVDAAIRRVPFSRDAGDPGRRRGHRHLARRHGARPRELRPGARARLPRCRAPTLGRRSRGWAGRPSRSASGWSASIRGAPT